MIPLYEDNKNKRARSGKNSLVALGIVVVIAGASLYYYRSIVHRDGGATMSDGQLGADQMFGNGDEGYSLAIPSDWRIAQEGSSSVAVYPAASSCKLTISSFSSVGESNRAAWIGSRLGADPSVNVAERSSEQVSLDDAPAIRWNGTIDGIPASFVYAFTSQHAYEIAPSIVTTNGDNNNDGTDGVASCEDALSELMADIHFSAEPKDAFNGDAMDDVAVAAATTSGSVLGESIVATSSGVTSSNANVSETATNTDDGADCL